GAAKLAKFQERVAAIEIKRGRGISRFQQLVVGGDGVGVFAFLVKFVGRFESRCEVCGAQAQRKCHEKQQRAPHGMICSTCRNAFSTRGCREISSSLEAWRA